MQVVNHGAAPQVKQVLSIAARTSAPSLPMSNMGQPMLDGDTLVQLGATQGSQLPLPQPDTLAGMLIFWGERGR